MLINQKAIYIKPPELPQKNYITSFDIFPMFSEQMKDVRINYFLKDTLFFDFDYSLRKRIVLQVDTQKINLAENHRVVSKIEVKPETVYVYGAAKSIKTLPDTMRILLPFENIQGEFEETVPIDTFDHAVLKLNYSEVTIKFNTKKLERKEIMVKVVKENFLSNYKLSQDSVAVIYYVDPEKEASSDGHIQAVANFNFRKKNKITLQVSGLPDNAADVELPKLTVIKKKSMSVE